MTITPQPGDRAEQEVLDALQERDTAEDWADRLADAIATLTGVEIGEHSSANNPWMNALEAVDTKPAGLLASPSPVSTPDTPQQVVPPEIPVLVCDACGGYALEDELPFPHGREDCDGSLRMVYYAAPRQAVVASPSPVAEDGRDAAVRLLAEKQHRRYDSEFDASHLGWQDFAGSAAEDVDALLAAGWGPAVATREASVIAEVLDEYDGDHIINAAHVVAEIRAALNAAQSGDGQ